MSDYIVEGNFIEAKKKWLPLSPRIFFDQITTLGENTDSISILFFLQYLGISGELDGSNELISAILISTFSWLPGAYYLSYEYHKRVLRESPGDTELLKSSLMYYSIPDYTMTFDDAYKLAIELKNRGIVTNDVNEILLQSKNNFEEVKLKKEFKFDDLLFDITDVNYDFDEAILIIENLNPEEVIDNLIRIGKKTKKYGVIIFSQYLDMKLNNEYSNNLIISVLKGAYSDIPGVEYLVNEYKKRF